MRANEQLLMFGSVALIACFAFEALATTNTMPHVISDLGSEQWYSLAAGVVLAGQVISTVIAGAVCDAKGVKLPLSGGIFLFTFGALAAGLAPSLAFFITGRAIQGLGGGLVFVSLYVLVGALVAPNRRPLFFAAFSYAWVVPSMIGPALAGYIVDVWHWRPVFYLITPVTLLALIPLAPILRRLEQHDSRALEIPHLFSGMLAAGGLIALQLAGGFTGVMMWMVFVLGTGLLAYALPRLFPTGTFRARRGVPSLVVTRFLLMGALVGAEFFLPLVLDRVHDWSASTTGWAIALGSITWTIGSWVQTKITNPSRRRQLPMMGATSVAAGAIIACLLPVSGLSPLIGLSGWALIGLGLGLTIATTSDLALGLTERACHGKVSAYLQLADSTGPALTMGVISITASTWINYGGQAFPYAPASAITLIVAVGGLLASLRNRTAQRT
ncbi:MAG: MFS transporter [Actinomycetaceae bacterium]|nr:MFS transporter [Actinomycetaceae bacterium]